MGPHQPIIMAEEHLLQVHQRIQVFQHQNQLPLMEEGLLQQAVQVHRLQEEVILQRIQDRLQAVSLHIQGLQGHRLHTLLQRVRQQKAVAAVLIQGRHRLQEALHIQGRLQVRAAAQATQGLQQPHAAAQATQGLQQPHAAAQATQDRAAAVVRKVIQHQAAAAQKATQGRAAAAAIQEATQGLAAAVVQKATQGQAAAAQEATQGQAAAAQEATQGQAAAAAQADPRAAVQDPAHQAQAAEDDKLLIIEKN
jgi:hypothetical protein